MAYKMDEIMAPLPLLNNKFPSHVIGKGIEKEVVSTIGYVDGEIEQLFYKIKGNWDFKYGVENAIEQTITTNVAELKIPVDSFPLP